MKIENFEDYKIMHLYVCANSSESKWYLPSALAIVRGYQDIQQAEISSELPCSS